MTSCALQGATSLSPFQPNRFKVPGLASERGLRASLVVLATPAFTAVDVLRSGGDDRPRASLRNNAVFAAVSKFVRFEDALTDEEYQSEF